MNAAESTIPWLVALTLVVSPATQAAPRAWADPEGDGDDAPALAADGLGPIRAGMAVADAELALGEDLLPYGPAPADVEERAEWDECHYVVAKRLPGVGFMVAAGRIVRVDVVSQELRTAEGAGIGTPEAELQRLYPGAIVEAHPYADFGHFLMVKRDDGNALGFETDGRAVTALRVGARGAVASIEGCE